VRSDDGRVDEEAFVVMFLGQLLEQTLQDP